MVYKYSDEVRKFIKDNVAGRTVKDLAKLTNEEMGTNFTYSKMKSYLGNHGLRTGTKKGNPKGSYRIYTPEISEFIHKNYKGTGHQAMADLLNKKFGTGFTKEQIKSYYGRFKLNCGLTGRFKKGQEPWNKDKPKTWKGGEETQFKKGNKPLNHRPVGSERINIYGYTEVKTAEPSVWSLKHQVVWEKNNGPIPEGCVIIFGDGDKKNIKIDNLVIATKAELMQMNRHDLIQSNADLTRTGANIAKVLLKIGDLNKEEEP